MYRGDMRSQAPHRATANAELAARMRQSVVCCVPACTHAHAKLALCVPAPVSTECWKMDVDEWQQNKEADISYTKYFAW
jgi:hypothetical protein